MSALQTIHQIPMFYLFDDGENSPIDKYEKEDKALIVLSFKRNLGIMEAKGKRVYLNGEKIMDKIIPELSILPGIYTKTNTNFPALFYFEDFSLKKSNYFVNVLEYK